MSQRKTTITVIFLLLIFVLPILGAHWLYYKGNQFIGHYSNHGKLLNPYVDLTQLPLNNLQNLPIQEKPFAHHWTLLSLANEDSDSLNKLYTLRQIRLMLGKNQDKIQRVLLIYGSSIPNKQNLSIDSIFRVTKDTSIAIGPYTGTRLFFIHQKDWPNQLNGYFIVDPRGQLIMVYTPPINPKHIMQDLQKLIA